MNVRLRWARARRVCASTPPKPTAPRAPLACVYLARALVRDERIGHVGVFFFHVARVFGSIARGYGGRRVKEKNPLFLENSFIFCSFTRRCLTPHDTALCAIILLLASQHLLPLTLFSLSLGLRPLRECGVQYEWRHNVHAHALRD